MTNIMKETDEREAVVNPGWGGWPWFREGVREGLSER